MAQASADPTIGVVVITGAGPRAFSAGMDLREFAAMPMSVTARRRQRRARAAPLTDFPKPVIAAVNGVAIGFGLELALQCDILVAATNATFALAEVRRGIIPGVGGTQHLARRIGQGRAMEMILTGRTVDAELAQRYRLVEHVVPAEELMARADALAREILTNAPVAVQLARGRSGAASTCRWPTACGWRTTSWPSQWARKTRAKARRPSRRSAPRAGGANNAAPGGSAHRCQFFTYYKET